MCMLKGVSGRALTAKLLSCSPDRSYTGTSAPTEHKARACGTRLCKRHLLGFPARAPSTHRQAYSELRIKNDAVTQHCTDCCSAKVYYKQADLQHSSHSNQTTPPWISISPVFGVNKQTNKQNKQQNPQTNYWTIHDILKRRYWVCATFSSRSNHSTWDIWL